MVGPIRFLSLLFLFSSAVLSIRLASGEDLRQLYEQIHAANRLDAKGQTPFHIKVAAQLYDLSGKPAGTGTAEEWWAAGRYRIEIEGPDGKEVRTSNTIPSETEPVRAQRSGYLLHLLLDQNVNPLSDLAEATDIRIVDREFAQTKFRCLSIGTGDASKSQGPRSTYCTSPTGTELRVSMHSGNYVGLRKQIARFHGTFVSLETTDMYGSSTAISGEVKLLQSFDPASSSFPEFSTSAPSPNESAGRPLNMVNPTILFSAEPEYPDAARSQSLKGAVDVLALVTREGRVGSVDVLATTSSVFSRAALEAVRKWKFTPRLVNGNATATIMEFQVAFQ